MRYRKLRIAWSVGWGLACVLLIVLWVRSYWWVDNICGDVGARYYLVCSFWGRTELNSLPENRGHGLKRNSYEVGVTIEAPKKFENSGFALSNGHGQLLVIAFPHWFLATVFGCAAVLPWLPWGWSNRFSLRTLLIATTLVAVMLGAIVWLGR
jgi:hypothetical protein